MNTYTLNVGSGSGTGHTIDLFDITELNLDISNIPTRPFPFYIVVDWGDGSDLFKPEMRTFRDYTKDSIIDEITKGLDPPFLTTTYKHIYKPSATALVQSIRLKIGAQYLDGRIREWIYCIKIRTQGFYENIGDLELVDVNLLDDVNYSSNFVFRSKVDNYIMELNNSPETDSETSFVINNVGKNYKKANDESENVVEDREAGIIKIISES
tara:strand:+ start:3470 stop:4102 length:633 start_codon:yes stop_codon:yes gene_type:complete